MPYISLKTNKNVSEDISTEIKSGFGKAIECIPGKSETWLMVSIEGNVPMWFKGSDDSCAMVEVNLLGSASRSDYDRMTTAVTDIVAKNLGISNDRIYVKYEETENWGWNGFNL